MPVSAPELLIGQSRVARARGRTLEPGRGRWQACRVMGEFSCGDSMIDGVRVHWAELGPQQTGSDKTPVVLLHGLADSHLSWRQVAPLLATDRRVLMPDLPGSGYSTRADVSYTLDWQARIIAGWLEAMELTSVDCVGHSFGGGIAQMLLLQCPERLRRIALVASGGLGRDAGFWLRLATIPFFVEHFGQPFMAFGTRRAIGGARLHGSAADLETLANMNRRPGTARAFSRTVRSVIGFRGQYRMFMQRAREVDEFPPMRAFWGEEDALIPRAHGDALVAATEGLELVVFPGAGHYLHQQQPEAFVAALRAFLDAPELPPMRLRPRSQMAKGSLVARVKRALGRARRTGAPIAPSRSPSRGGPRANQGSGSAERASAQLPPKRSDADSQRARQR